MVDQNIKKKYDSLKKKYNLPVFEKLDMEFELSNIEKDDSLLKGIKKKILEKIDFFCEIIEGLLQPDTNSLANMHECKFFEDNEKEDLYRLYKKLMFLNRSTLLLGINHSEGEEARFISNAHKQWPKLKKDLSAYISKIKDSWENESNIKEELGYLG